MVRFGGVKSLGVMAKYHSWGYIGVLQDYIYIYIGMYRALA